MAPLSRVGFFRRDALLRVRRTSWCETRPHGQAEACPYGWRWNAIHRKTYSCEIAPLPPAPSPRWGEGGIDLAPRCGGCAAAAWR